MIKKNVLSQLRAQGLQTFTTPTPLTPAHISELKKLGATDTTVKRCFQIAPSVVFLHSICDYLVGGTHPKCPHVHYEFCISNYSFFRLVTVMPVFTALWSCTLDKSDFAKKSSTQIEHCWNTLLSNDDATLSKIFSPSDLAKIRAGSRSDFTWHHDIHRGTMRLVSAEDHRICRHTGGNAIWSFGS